MILKWVSAWALVFLGLHFSAQAAEKRHHWGVYGGICAVSPTIGPVMPAAGVSYSYLWHIGFRAKADYLRPIGYYGGSPLNAHTARLSALLTFNAAPHFSSNIATLFWTSFGLGPLVGFHFGQPPSSNSLWSVTPGVDFDLRFKVPRGSGLDSYPPFFGLDAAWYYSGAGVAAYTLSMVLGGEF